MVRLHTPRCRGASRGRCGPAGETHSTHCAGAPSPQPHPGWGSTGLHANPGWGVPHLSSVTPQGGGASPPRPWAALGKCHLLPRYFGSNLFSCCLHHLPPRFCWVAAVTQRHSQATHTHRRAPFLPARPRREARNADGRSTLAEGPLYGRVCGGAKTPLESEKGAVLGRPAVSPLGRTRGRGGKAARWGGHTPLRTPDGAAKRVKRKSHSQNQPGVVYRLLCATPTVRQVPRLGKRPKHSKSFLQGAQTPEVEDGP